MTHEELYALDSAEKRWPLTEYVVEATHEEQFQVWLRTPESVTWNQGHGWLVTVGHVLVGPDVDHLERMPVTVSVIWNLIDGHLIAFYEAESLVVDHRMVEKYIRGNCSKHTNATNFHHCAHDLNIPMGIVERGKAPPKRSTER